jgi:hypothetical protein
MLLLRRHVNWLDEQTLGNGAHPNLLEGDIALTTAGGLGAFVEVLCPSPTGSAGHQRPAAQKPKKGNQRQWLPGDP